METFNLIKFGISDDFSHSFGNNAITNVISLNFNELLVSTTTDIYIIDYKNKMVKTKYQLKFSACTIIPDTKFIIGVSIKKGDLLIYYTNGNSPTLLKKFPTNQTGIYNVVFSKRSQSIITFGSEIKVFNFQYKTVKSKINVSITNRSSFPNKLDPSNLVFPQFDPKYEIILLPTEKGIMSFNLDGKKVKQLTTNPATNQTIFSSSSDLKDVLTFDSKSGMILYKNKNKAIQKFETIRSDILAIISIDSENSICLNSCHILFYTNVKTGKTFYYMNLNKNPTRLFLINLYNEPILCACFGSTLRALNLIIPWQVWRLNIEKITKISRCNKYMTAARILVETENSFVKFFSPRDKEQITIQLPDNCNHPIFYFYDRGTFENYTFDSQNQVYNIDVIKITNQLNFVRDTLFFILQNGSIIKIETNVQEGQKEVKLNCQAILMTICRIRLQKNTNNFKWCFAVASENGDLYIIDYFTFDEVCHFSIPNDGLIQMYYLFESNFIVLVFPKKTVLFDLETGKIVDSIEIDGNKTTSLFADFLMYGYESGHIQRVKIENNQLVMCNDVKQKTKNSSRKINKIENHMLKPHSCPITAFSFSPKIWISSGLDGNIVAYNYNFDIICKISLPLPLRSCLIMNGRRDIIVATATEIMEVKNDYLFYDVNTTKIRKTYQTHNQSNKNNELNVDNMNVVGEEEEEEEDSVDPEIKEIDNFDKMKDEFFCVNKTSLNNHNNKNIVEEADASSDVEKNEINKDEMKQIRKFRRNKMANNNNNNNKVSSITNQSVKSLPKKSEGSDINKDEDLKKKSDENQSTKTDQNKIKNDEKEKQNSDSNKNLPENEKNDLNKDKNSKENENKKENDPNSDTKLKSDTNTNENADSSSLLNKKDEDQNNSNNDSQLNDQDKLNSNGLSNENDTNNDLQKSSESDRIKDKDINETDSTQDDKFSESENSNLNSNENDSNLSDNSESIESTENEKSSSLNENADEANQSNESDNQNLSSNLNGNDQSETNEINENDETQINEQDNTNSDLDRSEENQITENTELNENEAINKDNTNEDNETTQNDFDNDSNETDTQQQQQQEEEEKSETDNNETETNNDEDSTSTDQQLSTNENETDLKSSIETENNKQEQQEEEEQHQEEHQEDKINETSPDDTQDSSQQPNINDLQQQPSVTLDDNICSINDGNFNSDEFFDDNKEDQKNDSNIDPNIIRSPTPPPIRPTLTAGSGSSQYDESDSARFNHERRSRTPSPRRSTRKDSFGGFRIPPNIVIDREAVLALYGRGRVEFRPFVEQIQREFLISHYGEEEGRTRHITLSYVNNLTSSIKKKQKQQNSNHHKYKKSSRQSTSLSSQINGNKPDQINGNKPDQINNDKSNSNDSIKNNGLTNDVQQQNKGLSISPPRPLRLPPINLNKSFSPTAYVYNYDNNTETFFNKLEINNGVKTPRRMHAYSVRQPLLMIQPKGAYIVKPNVPVKRNQSFRNQRKSPSYKTESPRRRLNMFNSENNEISDNSQNNTNSS